MLIMWLLSCAEEDNKTYLDDGTGYVIRTQTNEYGISTIDIELEEDNQHFLVTSAGQGWMSVSQLLNPDGKVALYWQDWYDGDENLTGAIWSANNGTVLNWPIRQEDGPLEQGKWRVSIGLFDDNGMPKVGEELTTTIQFKQDDNLEAGEVSVVLAYAQGVQAEPGVQAAVDAAVEQWADIWAQANITLKTQTVDTTLPSDIPMPDSGNDSYLDLSEEGNETDIVVVIGETIDGSAEYYGLTGSIPGPLVATPRSAVVVSWLANAGIDGEFDDEDIRIFGETLAHEVGHYLGLFHPVEVDYAQWDALDDTTTCSSEQECHTKLGENLMFPYPVCGINSCVPQQTLSDHQQAVLHRYVGVR